MTSGEWDLRALKALEEEEIKQFGAIGKLEKVTSVTPTKNRRITTASIQPSKIISTIDEYFDETVSSSPPPPRLPLSTFLTKLYSSGDCTKNSRICDHKEGVILFDENTEKFPFGHKTCQEEEHQQKPYHHHKRQQQHYCQQHHQDISTALKKKNSFGKSTSDTVGLPSIDESNEMMTMMMFLTTTASTTTCSACTITSPSSSPTPSAISQATATLKRAPGKGTDETVSSSSSLIFTSDAKSATEKEKEKKDGKIPAPAPTTAAAVSVGATTTIESPKAIDIIDFELEDHIKHCSCSCNHMGYGNSMDYQTTGFGCLPDVTEHSNIRRTISRQDSTSNSEFADVTSVDKTKKIAKVETKRKYCIFSLSIFLMLIIFAIASICVYQFVLLKPNRNSHDQRMKIVQKILKEVPLIDGHNDLPWNVRKYAHNSLELIDLSHDFDHKTIWHRPTWSQTDIPRMKEGLVGAQIWSAYVPCEAQGLDAVQLALEQIDIIHRFTEQYPKDLALVVSSQEILSAHRKGTLASLIGIEGGHALGSSLGVLRSLHALGARYLTLTHQCDTSWAGSSYISIEKGLSPFGKAVVKEMNRLGMMIDLSHSSDATARDVLEVTRAPVIFSHSVARSLCNSTRNIPDDILRAVADNGGLIMISFDSQYVSCDETSTLDDVIAHIKYIRSIVGIQHIGIGAGFDGISNPPKGLEDVSKYPNLLAALLKDTNWSEEDVAMLAGKNFLRVLKSVENVRDYWKRAAIQPVEISEPAKKSVCTYMSS